MNQGMAGRRWVYWRTHSAGGRGAFSPQAGRESPDPGAGTVKAPTGEPIGESAEEPDSLAAAEQWLHAAPHRLAGLEVGPLIGEVARIDDTYEKFPELEMQIPRRALVEELRSSLETAASETAASETAAGPGAMPLLIACAALDTAPSSASVATLLDTMARAGHDHVIARIVAMLAQRRPFTCDEIAPAVDELCRQGRLSAALAVVSGALDHIEFDPDTAPAAFGPVLKRILLAGGTAQADPAALAGIIISARNRLQISAQASLCRPPGQSAPGPRLLALAERVAAKLPRQSLASPHVAMTIAPWRTGPLGFAEFSAQWSEIREVEWLPLMRVGSAGEPCEAGVCAKPGQTGYLVYGPYVKLGAGDYRIRVRWIVGRPSRTFRRFRPVATIEAVSGYGDTYLAQRKFRVEDYVQPEHELLFRIAGTLASAAPIEVRVWTSGAAPLRLSSITVERITALAEIAATG
jgi:hypothetical protein